MGFFKVFTEIQQGNQAASYFNRKSRGLKNPYTVFCNFLVIYSAGQVYLLMGVYMHFFSSCVKSYSFLEDTTLKRVTSVGNVLVQRMGRLQCRVIRYLVTCFNMAWALK